MALLCAWTVTVRVQVVTNQSWRPTRDRGTLAAPGRAFQWLVIVALFPPSHGVTASRQPAWLLPWLMRVDTIRIGLLVTPPAPDDRV
jgi:hypothetical protein